MGIPQLVTDQQIAFFVENGYVVVPNVFSAAEVRAIRASFHQQVNSFDGYNRRMCTCLPLVAVSLALKRTFLTQ